MKTISSHIALFLVVLIAYSCSKDGGGSSIDCTSVPKSFATDVNPVIQSTCNVVGCHAAGSSNGPGALTNYSQVFAARSAIRSAVVSGAMPQGGSLSPAQKNSIACWVDSGAPNN